MGRKWLRLVASAMTLVGAALSGCVQQGGQQSEYLIVQPTQTLQPDYTTSAAPMQQAAPANAATPEPAQAPEASALTASATASEATATLMPRATTWKWNTMPASNEAVEKAKADLAHKLGISENEIALVLVIGQEFTTDGFYCRSSKGRISKEEPTVMIIGETILLRAVGSRYEYHADDQAVTFCRKLP